MTVVPCESHTQCHPCASISFCIFVIVINSATKTKEGKCFNRADVEVYRNDVLVRSLDECGIYSNYEEPKDLHLQLLSPEDKIKARNMISYNTSLSPGAITGEPTLIKMRLNLKNATVNATKSTLYANATLDLAWKDIRLAWWEHPIKVVDGIPFELRMEYLETEIWRPQYVMDHWPAFNLTHTNPENTIFHVVRSGEVTWQMPLRFESKCQIDLKRWPYNWYTCNLGLLLKLDREEEGDVFQLAPLLRTARKPKKSADGSQEIDFLSLNHFKDNLDWQIWKLKISRDPFYCPTCSDPFIVFVLVFLQRSPPYGCIAYVLSILMTMVTTFVLWTPPTQKLKIILSFCECVIIWGFVMFFEGQLPTSGHRYPALLCWYNWNIIIVGISLIISLLILLWSIKGGNFHFPTPLRMFICYRRVLRCLLLSPLESRNPLDDESHDTSFALQPCAIYFSEEPCRMGIRRVGKAAVAPYAPIIPPAPIIPRASITTPAIRNQYSEWILFVQVLDRILFVIFLMGSTMLLID